MNKYYYDLHLHSCLSPCGDNDMTPNNIAGMASIIGLNVLALTDHNSTKNCPAFFTACKKYGIIPIAGMELTTAEDIHIVCLFKDLDTAMDFGNEVEKHRILIKNRIDIFGDQLILDENDEQIGIEEYLLPNATDLSIDKAFELATSFNALCYPAHVDRDANGIIATLGTFPDTPNFSIAEFRDKENIEKYQELYPNLVGKRKIICSDAHYLENMPDKQNFLEIDDEPYSSALVRTKLIDMLMQ